MNSTYKVYIETKDGTHKPILIGEFKADESGGAINAAMKLSAVKKILGAQQTGQLVLVARR